MRVRRDFVHSTPHGTRPNRRSPTHETSTREWEAMMILWDQVFESTCVDASMVGTIRDVAQQGYEQLGRGCVLARISVQATSNGFGKKNHTEREKLHLSVERGIRQITNTRVQRTQIQYMPASIFHGSPVQDASQSTSATPGLSVPTKKEVDALWRAAGDKSTVLQLVGTSAHDPLETQGVLDANHTPSMGRSYHPERGELVLFLAMNYHGRNLVGADVVVEDTPHTLKAKTNPGF